FLDERTPRYSDIPLGRSLIRRGITAPRSAVTPRVPAVEALCGAIAHRAAAPASLHGSLRQPRKTFLRVRCAPIHWSWSWYRLQLRLNMRKRILRDNRLWLILIVGLALTLREAALLRHEVIRAIIVRIAVEIALEWLGLMEPVAVHAGLIHSR